MGEVLLSGRDVSVWLRTPEGGVSTRMPPARRRCLRTCLHTWPDAGVADAAWLTQAYLLLEDVRAGESMAKASHLCALICGRDDLYSCAQGPGVAAAWLVMRTMGLARPPHAGGGTRSGRAVSRVSTSR